MKVWVKVGLVALVGCNKGGNTSTDPRKDVDDDEVLLTVDVVGPGSIRITLDGSPVSLSTGSDFSG